MSPATFADLHRQQEERAGWIERFWSNTLKIKKELPLSLLKQRKILLERYWDEFSCDHLALMRYKEATTSSYVTNDVYLAVETSFSETMARIMEAIDRQTTTTAPPPASASFAPALPASEPHLPSIDLPTFAGEPLQWEEFKDTFKDLVDDIPRLSNKKKLIYLKSSLKGEAYEVVCNIKASDAGYKDAWEELEVRYGNTRLLSFAYHDNLYECPPAREESVDELKRLLNTFRQTVRSYTTLGKPVDAWDELLVYLLTKKLDPATQQAWDRSLPDATVVPTFKQLSAFLEKQIQTFRPRCLNSSIRAPPANSKPKVSTNAPSRRVNSSALAAATQPTSARKCRVCDGSHSVGYCQRFKELAIAQRLEQARLLDLCINCLGPGHASTSCGSKYNCSVCNARHHTSLHGAFPVVAPQTTNGDASWRAAGPPVGHAETGSSSATALTTSTRTPSLLATARVIVEARSGARMAVRALLDTGSDRTLISEKVVQTLQLPRNSVRVAISGIQDNRTGFATAEVEFSIRSRTDPTFELPHRALVLRKLTSLLPTERIHAINWPHIRELTLADPDFAVPAKVDLILGADACAVLLLNDSRAGPAGTPTAKLTPFGWVLIGPTHGEPTSPSKEAAVTLHCQSFDETNRLLRRFWEVEEVTAETPRSPEDERWEEHFQRTYSRDANGRYEVRLPFTRDPAATLAATKSTATRLLLSNERKLSRNAELQEKYEHFMSEYASLQHMQPVPPHCIDRACYYLPHHGVYKRHDPSGKIRVVFNASFRTASGFALNDCLATGPKLQSDLWMVLTRWRLFRIVFTTDVVKMFRQIRVNEEDADWQRVLWRSQSDLEPRDFRLTTVTYGTASAPFLALRVLQQLAVEEGHRFPQGAEAIRRHCYVDDVLMGADDLAHALDAKNQVVGIFHAGAFTLSKWASNHRALREEDSAIPRIFQESDGISTLGVTWNAADDTFSLRVALPDQFEGPCTKRTILAEVASLFDPLGWAAPTLIRAKILLQDLWIAGVSWDEELNAEHRNAWIRFRISLSQLEFLRIPRWTEYVGGGGCKPQLHGFCDASERAYAAAVYLRIERDGRISSTLLVAKTKVAPVKTLSIPRLELCGALLLSKLLTKVREGLQLTSPVTLTAWTDSSVTLHWIRGHASSWKPFVAHRVAELQTLLPPENWRHVRSPFNPADLATRGISSDELLHSDLWRQGPAWLMLPAPEWPVSIPETAAAAELEKRPITVHFAQESPPETLLTRFSSLSRLLSVLATCLRFANKARGRDHHLPRFITAAERSKALHVALQLSQNQSFVTEKQCIAASKELPRSSSLRALRPFLDEQGILRVGGRLENASMTYNEKHPIIVDNVCPLATLLIRDAHLRTLHGGPQLTQSLLMRRFWILHGRRRIRALIQRCVRCARYSGRTGGQLLGQLPTERLTANRAFNHTGVDYAGPIAMRVSPGRGNKSYKGYICLFVCLSTRAIHLEAVSDLTSAAFLAAFRRFTSRRGHCTKLFSDNGTAFRGADRELKAMFTAATDFYHDSAASLATKGTDWTFIPPQSPHFGGLWEAGVKSVKHHLRRVIGEATLTFEEMTTLLCQIEACLNSRPLHPLSDDPSEIVALTPGHFLLGEPPTLVPEPESFNSSISPHVRFALIANMQNQFWRRWSAEYLHHLQQLPKWRRRRDNVKVGEMVLIKDDSRPPATWPLARVEALHPGKDGLVRVVTLRTVNGTLQRPVVKICPLPVSSADVTDTKEPSN